MVPKKHKCLNSGIQQEVSKLHSTAVLSLWVPQTWASFKGHLRAGKMTVSPPGQQGQTWSFGSSRSGGNNPGKVQFLRILKCVQKYVIWRACQDFITFQYRRKEFHYVAQPGPPPTPNPRGVFPKNTRLQALLLLESADAAACCDNTKIMISVSLESGIHPLKATPFSEDVKNGGLSSQSSGTASK